MDVDRVFVVVAGETMEGYVYMFGNSNKNSC